MGIEIGEFSKLRVDALKPKDENAKIINSIKCNPVMYYDFNYTELHVLVLAVTLPFFGS